MHHLWLDKQTNRWSLSVHVEHSIRILTRVFFVVTRHPFEITSRNVDFFGLVRAYLVERVFDEIVPRRVTLTPRFSLLSCLANLCVVSSSNGAALVCSVYSGLNDCRTPPSRGTNSDRYSVTEHGWSPLPTIPYGRCGHRCLLRR